MRKCAFAKEVREINNLKFAEILKFCTGGVIQAHFLKRQLSCSQNRRKVIGAMRENKRAFIKHSGLLLTAASILFMAGCDDKKEEPHGDKVIHLTRSTDLAALSIDIKSGVRKIAIKNKMTDKRADVPETEIDISKISFALPGTPTYGSNPKLEVFNPEGGAVTSNFEFLSPHISKGKPTYIYTSANVVEGAGTDKPDMIAVFPNPKTEICEALQRTFGKKNIEVEIWQSSQEIDLSETPTPSKQPTILKPADYGSCVKTPSGLYFYQLIWKQ